MGRPKSENPLTHAERTARHRATNRNRGGRQLSAVLLSSEDAAIFESLKTGREITKDAEMVRLLIREAGSGA